MGASIKTTLRLPVDFLADHRGRGAAGDIPTAAERASYQRWRAMCRAPCWLSLHSLFSP